MRWPFPFLRLILTTAALVVLLLLVVLSSSVEIVDGFTYHSAFSMSSSSHSGWGWRSLSSSRASLELASTSTSAAERRREGHHRGGQLVMDTERDDGNGVDRLRIDLLGGGFGGIMGTPSPLARRIPLVSTTGETKPDPIDDAHAVHGMPWSESVDGTTRLLYMPFWEWQMNFMRENLTNLHVVDCDEQFSYREATDSKQTRHRVVNLCFRSDEYRKIRMTYYDAGKSAQVFNSPWYPDPRYDLPVLGVDLLSFADAKKNLAVVDFQTLHEDVGESGHALPYEQNILAPIRNDYDALRGRMSARFYDEARFFSDQMLFGRFDQDAVVDGGGIVSDQLGPAYRRYVKAHVDLVRRCEAEGLDDRSPESVARVLDRQAAYDAYSADRDPAHALFARVFGREWADGYVHDFLFDMSKKKGREERR